MDRDPAYTAEIEHSQGNDDAQARFEMLEKNGTLERAAAQIFNDRLSCKNSLRMWIGLDGFARLYPDSYKKTILRDIEENSFEASARLMFEGAVKAKSWDVAGAIFGSVGVFQPGEIDEDLEAAISEKNFGKMVALRGTQIVPVDLKDAVNKMRELEDSFFEEASEFIR